MNREYKSDVFSMLLEDPVRALDVYNALNHTNYEDPGEIQVTKLDSGVSLSVFIGFSVIYSLLQSSERMILHAALKRFVVK